MAVTVLNQPISPNVTGTNLVYSLSSSLANSPQFRYVTDIYESGSNNYITTIKTYPNIHYSGIIDVSRELEDQLTPDYNWKTTGSVAPVNTVKTFDLRFGEEYGTSVSSSRTTYTGSTSNYLELFPGTVYKNEGSFNFKISSVNCNGILSNHPEATSYSPFNTIGPDTRITLTLDDYHTITLFQNTNKINVAWIDVINGGAKYSGVVSGSGIDFTTYGIGPKNLEEYNPLFATYNSDPDIGYLAFSPVPLLPTCPGGAPTYNYTLKSGPYATGEAGASAGIICSNEYTRFAFINQYGFWDYYNVYTPLRRVSQVDRSLYERPFVRYEDSIGSYDISDRGNTQYKTDYRDNYSITTDWLSSTMAEWLKEMFVSEEVYIQKNGNFIPVNITNTTIQRNLNTSRNKLFQYTIEFKYANDRISR